jgi:hypothetical protein
VFDRRLVIPHRPDYAVVQAETAATITRNERAETTSAPTSSRSPATEPSPRGTPTRHADPTRDPVSRPADTESVDQMCAYHPGRVD